MSANELTIRMYRQGLGDCFLLKFPPSDKPFYLLIDCGALVSKHYDKELMKKVVTDIHDETGGHIHVLAVTHEHWDHISGFMDAKEIFDTITVDTVWLAWLENPSDPEASEIKNTLSKQKMALEMALGRLPGEDKYAHFKNALSALFGFEGGLGVRAGGVEDAWNYILNKGKKVICDSTKHPLEMAGAKGVRFYVLGPPRDPVMIKKLLSTKETYDDGRHGFGSFVAALGQAAESGGCISPFDERFRITLEQAKEDDCFRQRYGFDQDGQEEWRRIDYDWLNYTGELALQLDSYTNNTSLALAIELVASGKVLIFPGDAQVGNWLSWEELSWKVKESDGTEKTVTINDLFENTVFYKVGHHGSHNATLRTNGLEKMSHQDLVALIPVHRLTADDQGWQFPFPPLWQRLKEKARGRVVLSDSDNLDDISDKAKENLTEAEWESFAGSTKISNLYVEYRITY